MFERNEELIVTIGADIAPLRSALTDAGRLGRGFGRDIGEAFEQAAVRGRGLSDVIRDLVESLSERALDAALAPFERAIGDGFAALLSGVFGGAPVPFAKGGVIASPIGFSLGGGRLGVAGESGPEAILPLRRGSDGSLGVAASEGAAPVHVTLNVTTPDAASFRRSEGQVAAMLSRAVTRGRRGL